MTGLEGFLSESLKSTIRKNLSQKTLKNIEKRLFEKFGISFTQAILEFNKMDTVLREFFGPGTDGLERKFFENLVQLYTHKSKNNTWLRIGDQNLSEKILESYADDDKKKILYVLSDKAMIIQDTLHHCKIPQTSGYRKINSLIDDGILIKKGYTVSDDGKKITKYTSLFDNVQIAIEKNKLYTICLPKKEIVETSSIIQIMSNL
jgi:hypothetical protein